MQRVKDIVRRLLFVCVGVEARIVRLLRCRRRAGTRVVGVLEPCHTSAGCTGDEALIEGTVRFLREQPGTRIEVISFLDHYVGRLPAGTAYGGSLCRRTRNPLVRLADYFSWPWFLARYDNLYVLGADLIDGYYGPDVSVLRFFILQTARRVGVQASLISCSFSESAQESVRRSARSMLHGVRVHSRDVYSASRLSGILGRPVEHSTDVAFGLVSQASAYSTEIAGWIEEQHSASRHVLVLNVNLLPITKQRCGREDEYLRRWGEWVVAVIASDVSLVLLPHDYRGTWSDDTALARLAGALNDACQTLCLLPAQRLYAGEVKHIVSCCDLTVTGRMHLAIASLGSGVPVIAYAYQSKFEGVLEPFGIGAAIRPIQRVFDCVQEEAALAREAIAGLQARRNAVNAQLNGVVKLAQRNVASENA